MYHCQGMYQFPTTKVMLGLLTLTAGAFAQSATTVTGGGDLQRFQPATTPYAGFAASAGDLLAPGDYALGAHLDYARNPLVYFRDGVRVASSVKNNTTLQLHLALGLFERFELGIALPFVLQQNGNDPRFFGLPSQAVGDLRISPRIQLFSIPEAGFFVTASPTITVPVSRTDALVGESSVRFFPEAGVSWRHGGWFLSADALFRWRAKTDPLDKVRLGNELQLLFSTGRALTQDLEAIVEFSGGAALETASAGARGNPLEALGGLRYRMGGQWTIDGAMGLGVLAAPGVPDYRLIFGLTYGAGRPRPSGTCLLRTPEGDQIMRLSGLDRDGDGIDDACDLCPYQSGPAPSGCPAPQLAQTACVAPVGAPPMQIIQTPASATVEGQAAAASRKRRVVVEPIQFDFDSDTVRASSIPLIQIVIDELKELPPEVQVQVVGHTDMRGDSDYNIELSKRRAASVVKEMIRLGVDSKRLNSDGFGFTRPVAPHDDADDNRQKNRRVEFIFSMPDVVEGAQQ